MASSFGSRVDTAEGNSFPQAHVEIARSFLDIRPWCLANNPAGVVGRAPVDVRVFGLSWICASGSKAVRGHGLRSIRGKGRDGRRSVVLEEAVVLEANPTNASEDGAFHEAVCVGAKSVDNVMVVPDIDLRNGCIGTCERLGAIPADIVLEVVFVAVGPHLVVKRKVSSLVRVANVCPGLERAIDSNTIIVDLITATNHDMEGSLFVRS